MASELMEIRSLDILVYRRLAMTIVLSARNARRAKLREAASLFGPERPPSRETQELSRAPQNLEEEALDGLCYLESSGDRYFTVLSRAIQSARRMCSRQAADITLPLALLRSRLS